MSSHSYRHIFKYTSLFGSVQALYVVLAVVRSKVMAVLIGAVGIGLADLFSRTIELVGNLTNFGLGLSAVKRLSELYAQGRSAVHLRGPCAAYPHMGDAHGLARCGGVSCCCSLHQLGHAWDDGAHR